MTAEQLREHAKTKQANTEGAIDALVHEIIKECMKAIEVSPCVTSIERNGRLHADVIERMADMGYTIYTDICQYQITTIISWGE